MNDDPGWFWVVNVGEDSPFDVAVIARCRGEHVTEKADVVRPYRDEIDPSPPSNPGQGPPYFPRTYTSTITINP